MGLSPSKAVIDKLSVASARASHEGREDIQSLLSDNDFIDNLHGLWQQIPSTLQSRIAPAQQREVVSPNIASQRKRSAASMLAIYKNRGNRPARCKAATLKRKRRHGKPDTTAYKIRKRQLYLQTVGHRQKDTFVKPSSLKRRPETKRKGQMRQTIDTESDELQQLVKNIGRWKFDIPGFFGEEVSELILYNALAGTYRFLRHLEQRTVRDEVRIRLLKVLFHRLLEKVCNQYARPKDLERVTRIISISGLVDDDPEQIGKRINSWGKIGRRLDMLCKDLSDGHPKNEQHLGILFRLPKKLSDNYLEKLGYKSRRRFNEIERFKKSGLCSKEKFKEVDEFAGRAFSYLWERVQAAIIQESLPVDEQLLDEPTESDKAEPQTGGSHQEVTVPTARTASSVENRTRQSITQPALSEVFVTFNASPLTQPLQSDTEVQFNGAMPDQMEGDVWPFMQRIPGFSNRGPMDMQSAADSQVLASECAMFSPNPLTQPFQSDTEVQFNGAMPDQMEGDVWPFMQRIPGFSNRGPMDMQSAADSQVLASECAMFSSNPLTQPLQPDTEVQFNGAMPDQMEGDVWPFMQRICTTTADMENTTKTTNQFPLDQDSALHNGDPGDTDAQFRGSERSLPRSLDMRERARRLDCSVQSDLSSNTPAENHAASKYQSCLVDQSIFSYGEMGRHHSNNQCGNYHYIAPITALEA